MIKRHSNVFYISPTFFVGFLFVWLFLLFFTHFWHLSLTARFSQDESSDLARMYSYWQTKKITLIGPISNDNEKVFGSLTYYMQLPFAALYDFAPVGPVVGTAFWSVITAMLLASITVFWTIFEPNRFSTNSLIGNVDNFRKIPTALNTFLMHRSADSKRLLIHLILSLILIVIWHPLLMTSRSAWNPYLIPFWLVFAVWIDAFRFPHKKILVGLFLGLSIHHHYLAIFASGAYLCWQLILNFKQKKYRSIIELVLGYCLAILPFVIFDLRHPPGLFFGKYLASNTPNVVDLYGWQWIGNLLRNFSQAIVIIGSYNWASYILTPLIIGLIIADWTGKNNHCELLVPVFAQIGGCVVLEEFNHRYFLPGLIFFLLWLLIPRIELSFKIWTILIVTLISISLWQLLPELTKPKVQPSMMVVTQAGEAIESMIIENPNITNYNVAALTGMDMDALALKYRDLLSIKNIHFKAPSEYDTTENLFVVSDQDEVTVRADKNYAMSFFKEGVVRQVVPLSFAPWKVYWFSY